MSDIKELLGYCQHSDQRGRPHPAKDVAYAALRRIEELEGEVISLAGVVTMAKRLRDSEEAFEGPRFNFPEVQENWKTARTEFRKALADHFKDDSLR